LGWKVLVHNMHYLLCFSIVNMEPINQGQVPAANQNPDLIQLQQMLRLWEEEHQTPGYDPHPCLTRLEMHLFTHNVQ
jgi:hypothetical protein